MHVFKTFISIDLEKKINEWRERSEKIDEEIEEEEKKQLETISL